MSKKQIAMGCELKMNYCVAFGLAFGARYREIRTKLAAQFLVRCTRDSKDRDYALTCFVISSCKLLAFSSSSTFQTNILSRGMITLVFSFIYQKNKTLVVSLNSNIDNA